MSLTIHFQGSLLSAQEIRETLFPVIDAEVLKNTKIKTITKLLAEKTIARHFDGIYTHEKFLHVIVYYYLDLNNIDCSDEIVHQTYKDFYDEKLTTKDLKSQN